MSSLAPLTLLSVQSIDTPSSKAPRAPERASDVRREAAFTTSTERFGAVIIDTNDADTSALARHAASPFDTSEEEQREVAELKARDREVRSHEKAHARTGAPYTGAPTYETVRGPNGQQFAVSGKTPIDVSPIPGDPAATTRKMEVVKQAALAPAEPSAQDRAIAARAEGQRLKALQDVARQASEETEGASASGIQPSTAEPAPARPLTPRNQAIAAYAQVEASRSTEANVSTRAPVARGTDPLVSVIV